MGKRIRKAIGALIIAVAIAVTQIPVSDVEAVDTASASDFQMDGSTLVKYKGTAEDVSVSDSVKKIEAGAFSGNDTIQRVTIGAHVKTIGSGAFEGCSGLQTVIISDSVETIEQAAFADCPSLNSVRIGTGLRTLGNGVFAGDAALSHISFDTDNPKFTCDDGAVYNKDGWDTLYVLLAGRKEKNYTMPSGVSKIKPYAFWGDRHLQIVTVSGNVDEISAYAFSNCANLKEVNIPYSVKMISLKAFENCIRLRNISIPVSVGTIHSTAFDGCTRLTIDAADGSTAKAFADALTLEDIEVTEYEDTDLDTINDTDLEAEEEEEEKAPEVDYYHEVTHMNPLESEEDESVKGKSKIIGSQTFVFMDNASATVQSGEPDFSTFEGIAVGETGETIAILSGNTDEKGRSFPKYTIIDDTKIANQAYYHDDRTSIEIPDTITQIGDFAFARSEITAAAIPEGVTKIGFAAFYHCNRLTNVTIPATIEEIAPSAFANTPWLQNWEENGSGDFLIVGDGILLDYRGGSGIVTIPGGVKTIGAGAFADHTEITKVILSNDVITVGEGAFAGCSNLTQIEGGNSLKQIKDRAYQGCPIQNIMIPASVEKIGLKAFTADSAKTAGAAVVTFEGSALPTISYEASAGKLYNDAYRGLVFDGIRTAVVQDGAALEGTVLDGNLYGFRGQVYFAEAKKTADSPSEQTDTNSAIEQADADSNAGQPASDAAQQAQLPIGRAVNVAGSEADNNETDVIKTGVIVTVDSTSMENTNLAGAVLDGAEKEYLLHIADSNDAKEAIRNACRKIYGSRLPSNLQAYEITLQEADTLLPITGLGRQKIEITIPLPNGIGEENLHVICLDADGQPEETESRIAAVDGMDCIIFTTNHFSPFGIYNYISGNTAAVNDGQAVFTSLSGKKDDSPDTGDYGLHPKWFLGAGLLFAGLAVFFYRGKRRIS